MKKLPAAFYKRKDVLLIAKELIGKVVVSNIDGRYCSGRIVETEAYVALTDKASHSFGGRRTARNEHMYAPAATVYVYICYGMHQMLNVVTNDAEIPDAILIRAIEPLEGIDIMLKRTGKAPGDHTVTKGPGNVAKALGISKIHSGASFLGDDIHIYADSRYTIDEDSIGTSKRIGVEPAGADGLLPYRYFIKGNKYVSGRPTR